MTHPRKAIREAFLQRLLQAETAAGTRVFKSRMAPIDADDDEQLPAILVYAREEDRDPNRSYGPDADDSWVEAELKIVVEGMVRGGRTVDDKLDDLAAQIEAALEDWDVPGLEGAVVRLGDTDIDVVSTGFKKPVGAIGLVWHVRYRRPWRVRPEGTRPDTVDIIVNGGLPERLITRNRGLGNP